MKSAALIFGASPIFLIFMAGCSLLGDRPCTDENDCPLEESCTAGFCIEANATTCIDDDGDGYGEDCDAGPDCDDSDDSVFEQRQLFVDTDGDGVFSQTTSALCIGASVPDSASTDVGDDCDDNDRNRFRVLSIYLDNDGDLVPGSVASNACIGSEIPEGASLQTGDDCNDNDPNRFREVDLFVDEDLDGVASGTSQTRCIGNEVPEGASLTAPLIADCDDATRVKSPQNDELCDGMDNNCNGARDEGVVCGCESVENDGQLYLVCPSERKLPWNLGRQFCEELGHYRLPNLESEEENNYLSSLQSSFWTGLNDREQEGVLQWTDGSSLVTNLLLPNEASGSLAPGEDCIEGSVDGWRDLPCATSLPIICEYAPPLVESCIDTDGDNRGEGCVQGPDCNDNDADRWGLSAFWRDDDGDEFVLLDPEFSCEGQRIDGGVFRSPRNEDCDDDDAFLTEQCGYQAQSFEGKTYRVYRTRLSWLDSLDECVNSGLINGQLVSINSVEENEFVQMLTARVLPAVNHAIGLQKVEGEYQWLDGTTPSFNGFDIGLTPEDDCVVMKRGEWLDTDCITDEIFRICEGD